MEVVQHIESNKLWNEMFCRLKHRGIDYWMGHKGSTYHDIQMNGIEFLRELYANAGLSIIPIARNGKVDLLSK